MQRSASRLLSVAVGLISALTFAADAPIARSFRADPNGAGGYVQYDVGGLSAVSQLVVGDRFGCALSKGTVHCWGQNGHGQLGRGFADPQYRRPEFHSSAPTQLSQPVIQLAASATQVCAQLADGQNACWGDFSDAFFLGADRPSAPAIATPTLFPGFNGKVFLQRHWGCAVSKGLVTCRGRLPWSAPSFDARSPRMKPVQVDGLANAHEVLPLNRDFGVARTDAGLWWLGAGSPRFLGEKLSTVTNEQTVGLMDGTDKLTKWIGGPCFAEAAGRVRCIEHGTNPVEGLTDVKQYVSGELFGCELRSSGRVTCHGASDHGAVGPKAERSAFDPVDVGLSDVRELVSTERFVCALNGKAQVRCWGEGFGKSPKLLWSGAQWLAGGEDHLCMVSTAGTVRCIYGVREAPDDRPAQAVSARFLDEERFVVGWKRRYSWADVWRAKKKVPDVRLDLCSAGRGFTLSSDGRWLAGSACSPGMLNNVHVLDVWSTADWRRQQVPPMWGGACVPRGSSFSQDPTAIAFAPGHAKAVWFDGAADVPGKELDRMLCLFDFGENKLVKTLPVGTAAARIYAGADETRIVVQGVPGLVALTKSEPPDWARSCVVKATTGEVLAWVPPRAFVSHDGEWFLLGGERFQTSDPASAVWSGTSQRDECRKPAVVISDDDSRILYSCEEGKTQLLAALTGAVLATLKTKGAAEPLAISPAGKTALVSGIDGEVIVWSLGTGEVNRLRTVTPGAGVPD